MSMGSYSFQRRVASLLSVQEEGRWTPLRSMHSVRRTHSQIFSLSMWRDMPAKLCEARIAYFVNGLYLSSARCMTSPNTRVIARSWTEDSRMSEGLMSLCKCLSVFWRPNCPAICCEIILGQFSSVEYPENVSRCHLGDR